MLAKQNLDSLPQHLGNGEKQAFGILYAPCARILEHVEHNPFQLVYSANSASWPIEASD